MVETHTQMRSESRTDYKACAVANASVPSKIGEEGEMEWVARVGVDWADEKHDWVLKDESGRREGGVIQSSPEAVHAWVAMLRALYPSGKILITLEQSRGALIHALMQYDFLILLPINPRALSLHRQSLHLSGAKSDPTDADLLCDFGAHHFDKLRVLVPGDSLTRKLALMAEARRGLVEQRTAHIQALTAACKQYFPQLLTWFGGGGERLLLAFLQQWPTLEQARSIRRDRLRTFVQFHSRWSEEKCQELHDSIRAATALTTDDAVVASYSMQAQAMASMIVVLNEQIARYDRTLAELVPVHPDAEVFASFPGAGKVIVPRLIAAFGTERSRFADASEIQCYSGIAPVVDESGKHRRVSARWHAPMFLRQTFHEFALASIPHCPWAKAYYQQRKEGGAEHHVAVRALAFCWMRILFRCWKNHEKYDEARYLAELKRKRSPLIQRLAA